MISESWIIDFQLLVQCMIMIGYCKYKRYISCSSLYGTRTTLYYHHFTRYICTDRWFMFKRLGVVRMNPDYSNLLLSPSDKNADSNTPFACRPLQLISKCYQLWEIRTVPFCFTVFRFNLLWLKPRNYRVSVTLQIKDNNVGG